MNERVATGFDFAPLPSGNVRFEFFADNGTTFNTQVVTRKVIENMPAVVGLVPVCMDQGPEAVRKTDGEPVLAKTLSRGRIGNLGIFFRPLLARGRSMAVSTVMG